MGDIAYMTKEDRENLQAVYQFARGLCLGCDWNAGTHAKVYRNKLIHAVNKIKKLPSLNTIDESN